MNRKSNLSQKCNKTAELLRYKALQHVKNGEYYEALLKFNKSLCHAESNSSTLSMIYANRADVFFHLKLYDKCLNNISLARDCDTSTTQISSDLDELEEKCLENIANQIVCENQWEFFKLSYPANDKIPFIVNCLEVKNDKKFGRYITTNRALNAGDILAIEKPFFKYLKTDADDCEYPVTNTFNYCVNCLLDNFLDLTPCPDCTITMFCSEACREEAHQSFHKYECNILDLIPETGNFQMAVRNFFTSLSICNGSIDELKELMRKSDELNPTIFNFDSSDENCPAIAKNYLMSMISLTHQTNVTVKDLSYVFQRHPHLRKIWETDKEFINKYLERMMQIEILNFHGIKGRSLSKADPVRRCVGDGSFAFCSLLNHSCCPNVMRIVVEDKMVVIVEKPIKVGDQLFDCYIGDSFYFKAKNFRHEELEDYNFVCECNACANENIYTDIMSGMLNIFDMETLRQVQRSYNELQDPRKELSVERAKQLSKKYSILLNQNYRDEIYPCREIILLQLCVIKCFLTAAKTSISFP